MDLGFEVKVVRGDGGDQEVVSFGDLISKPTVVSVYMRNNTGSCDKQNDALVADLDQITQRGWQVVALSRDTGGSHQIAYVLVSDPKDLFAQAAEAVVEKKMYGRTYEGPLRSAWLLAPGGKVQAVIEKVEAKAHGEQVLAVIDSL